MSNEDKQGILVIIVLIAIVAIIWNVVINANNNQGKSYEFALNGEIFKSNNCKERKGIGYCEYEGKFIQVDNYYEVE